MASRLLSLVAFLNFDDIFLDLLNSHVPAGDEANTNRRWRSFISLETSVNRHDVESAFAVLQTYSLVQRRRDQGMYTMHKLVHAWGRDRPEIGQQRQLRVAALELLTDVVGRRDVEYRIRLVPHVVTNADAVSTAYSLSKGPTEGVLNFIAEISDFLKELGRWSDQHQFQSFHFCKICELAGPKDLSTVTSLNNLAIVVRELGKYEEAEVMHRETLSVREKVLGKEH
jgi:hypothetical protein